MAGADATTGRLTPDRAVPDACAPGCFALDAAAPDCFPPDRFALDVFASDVFAPDRFALDVFASDVFAPDCFALDVLPPDVLASDCLPRDAFVLAVCPLAGFTVVAVRFDAAAADLERFATPPHYASADPPPTGARVTPRR